jgi:hypothetical protein
MIGLHRLLYAGQSLLICESESQNRKGTHGRHFSHPGDNSRLDGHCIGDLVTHRASARLTQKGHVGIETEDKELSRVQRSWHKWASQGHPDELCLFSFPSVNGWAEGHKRLDPSHFYRFRSIPRCSKRATSAAWRVDIKTAWPPDDTTQSATRALLTEIA